MIHGKYSNIQGWIFISSWGCMCDPNVELCNPKISLCNPNFKIEINRRATRKCAAPITLYHPKTLSRDPLATRCLGTIFQKSSTHHVISANPQLTSVAAAPSNVPPP